MKISMDGKRRYSDNIFVERLWRTVKYEEVYLKAYGNVTEARRELGDYFRFYNDLRLHQALGYRTPAEVFHGEQDVGEEESNGRRRSPGTGAVLLAGAAGPSLNSALILSKEPGPRQMSCYWERVFLRRSAKRCRRWKSYGLLCGLPRRFRHVRSGLLWRCGSRLFPSRQQEKYWTRIVVWEQRDAFGRRGFDWEDVQSALIDENAH